MDPKRPMGQMAGPGPLNKNTYSGRPVRDWCQGNVVVEPAGVTSATQVTSDASKSQLKEPAKVTSNESDKEDHETRIRELARFNLRRKIDNLRSTLVELRG